MKEQKAENLLSELIKDPVEFSKLGKTHDLLQEYFHDYDVATLRPLLQSQNPYITSAATFIVSELGKKACPLVEDCILLLNHENESVKFEILETIFLCSRETRNDRFYYVPCAMKDKSEFVRMRAMELTSNAYQDQINAGVEQFRKRQGSDSAIHIEGLLLLLDGIIVQQDVVESLLKSELSLARKYGVILATKFYHIYPSLIELAIVSEDDDIKTFSKEFVDQNS